MPHAPHVKLLRATNANLLQAVTLWCADREAAKRKYGHISGWDVSEVTNMAHIFEGQKAFRDDLSAWNVSKVTTMEGMFDGCEVFMGGLAYWSVSRVTNMHSTFRNCHVFNDEIGVWDVSRVTDMSEMFSGCEAFNQPLHRWDVFRVTTTRKMFLDASSFEGVGLSKWEMNSIEDISYMFMNATALDKAFHVWPLLTTVNMTAPFGA